jgi:hypothetical protein
LKFDAPIAWCIGPELFIDILYTLVFEKKFPTDFMEMLNRQTQI